MTFTATQGFDMREFTVADNGIRYDARSRKGFGMLQTRPAMEHCPGIVADLATVKKAKCHRVQLLAGSRTGNGAKYHFPIGAREIYG